MQEFLFVALDPVDCNAICGDETYYDVEGISDFFQVSGGLSTCSENFGDTSTRQINITAARKCFMLMNGTFFKINLYRASLFLINCT